MPRSPVPALLRAAVVAVCTTLVLTPAGCGRATEPSSGSAPDPELVLTRTEWGGLCPEGACDSVLEVRGTGEWSSEPGSDGSTPVEGTLDPEQLAALADAVATTRVGEPLPTGDCPPAYDGRAVDYEWQDASGSGEWSSCGSVIDEDDPLVRWLDELSATVTG